jgi:hypothetical protein
VDLDDNNDDLYGSSSPFDDILGNDTSVDDGSEIQDAGEGSTDDTDSANATDQAKTIADLQRQLAEVQERTVANAPPQQAPSSPADLADQQFNQGLTDIQGQSSKLQQKYNQAVKSDDTEAINSLYSEMQNLSDQRVQMMVNRQAESIKTEARATAQYDVTLKSIEQQFPQIDPDNPAYDAEIMSDVVALMNGYRSAGADPADALGRAANRLLKSAPAQRSAQSPSLRRTADTANMPPNTSTLNTGVEASELPDTKNMSDKEFFKLPSKVRSSLRGDDFTPTE